MKFSRLISEMITTASFAGWSVNPSGNGFDMPREAVENIRKKRKNKGDLFVLFGLTRREYAKAIGTEPNYYGKTVRKLFNASK